MTMHFQVQNGVPQDIYAWFSYLRNGETACRVAFAYVAGDSSDRGPAVRNDSVLAVTPACVWAGGVPDACIKEGYVASLADELVTQHIGERALGLDLVSYRDHMII